MKTQNQRRQFRIGLIANLAFYNKLNLGDLQALIHQGDPSGLATLSNTTALTIPVFQQVAATASPYDILRILAPDRATALADSLRRIADLSDYIQTLCGYLAANQALEPAHDVICRLLRSGADFGHAVAYNPIHVAAAAAAPLCTSPDLDGSLAKTSAQSRRNTSNTPGQMPPFALISKEAFAIIAIADTATLAKIAGGRAMVVSIVQRLIDVQIINNKDTFIGLSTCQLTKI